MTIRRVDSTVEKNSKLSFGKVIKADRNTTIDVKDIIDRKPMSVRCSLLKRFDFLIKEYKRIMVGESEINRNKPRE